MRLSPDTLARVPQHVARPDYAYDEQDVGIVHFGMGAFHRAHQAWYTDRAMAAGDRDWAIGGVSLRSAGVAEQLNPQAGLYTLAERSAAGTELRIMGSVRNVWMGAQDEAAIIASLAGAGTALASFTITEKGYCRAVDGSLDTASARPGSVYDLLARGLGARRAKGLPGLTLLSCDNIADNGRQLRHLLEAYLTLHDPTLIPWIAEHCTFPVTMVDRIVPATTSADLAQIAKELGGLADEGAVLTEPFSQWVVEDRFAGPRPCWEAVGAQLVDDVAPFESAKLRMLNGAHSALAYLGLQQGHIYVHEAVADPVLRPVVEQLIRIEAAPTVPAARGQNLDAYADALLVRFANPALRHRLGQIAMDGSQKIPQRWLETLTENQRRGRQCPATLTALASWLRHVRGDNGPVDDPLADLLARAWERHGISGIIPALFGPHGVVSDLWVPNDLDTEIVKSYLQSRLSH